MTLAVSAAGSSPLAYEWEVRNAAGATLHLDASASTSRLNVPTHISGTFTAKVTVRNRAGTTTSAPIRVAVAPSAPILLVPPAPVTAFSGRGAVLSVTAAGTEPFSYQWYRDGILVGTGRTLSFARVSSSAAGDYTVDVTNSLGRTTSAPVRLTVDATARLANLSTRISLGAGRPLIAGFVISGPASQRVLVRGIGPGLAAFGLSGLLPDPVLTVFDSAGRPVAGNDNFDPVDTPAGVVAGVGAFPLNFAQEAVLAAILPPGAYTAQLGEAANRDGLGLLEVYRADDAPSRLVNLSSRGFVGAGSSLAIAGLAIEGESPCQYLVRAVGPTLQDFDVGDALADPVLTIASATGEVLFTNDDWGTGANAAETPAAAARLGAFALRAGSRDAALLVSLAPGNYTAVTRGAGDTTGTALLEVYEVP